MADKSMYNSSGYIDKTAYDAITAADRKVKEKSQRDKEAEEFVRIVKKLARAYEFRMLDRIKFEDVYNGKKYM